MSGISFGAYPFNLGILFVLILEIFAKYVTINIRMWLWNVCKMNLWNFIVNSTFSMDIKGNLVAYSSSFASDDKYSKKFGKIAFSSISRLVSIYGMTRYVYVYSYRI